MNTHEREGNKSPASKVFTHEAVDGFPIFELVQQSSEAFGQIIQGKHNLVDNGKSGTASFS
jgi:hypothetical protein